VLVERIDAEADRDRTRYRQLDKETEPGVMEVYETVDKSSAIDWTPNHKPREIDTDIHIVGNFYQRY
jgi:hypothetical protein